MVCSPKTIQFVVLLGIFLWIPVASSAQSLQVEIISNDNNERFCEGSPEFFNLSASPTGGKEPYTYEWTFSWNNEKMTGQFISVRPETSGVVTVKVTDSSFPPKSKEATFKITEVSVTADFVFSPDNSCAQTPVLFSPTVSGGTPEYHYYWDFGDGYISEEKNPVHEFISPGCSGNSSFIVGLSVYDLDGCFTYVSKTVQVKNKPFLYFEDSENPFSPFKHCHPVGTPSEFDVVVENYSQYSCISSYHIDWGDGMVEDGVSFPIRHTYNEAGAFELIITATNTSGCDLKWSKFVYNQSTPAAGLESYGGTEGCAPIEFSFGLEGYENNSVGTTYTWNFGDGTPPIVWDHNDPFNNDTIDHLYTRTSCDSFGPGYFTTVVTVNNGCGEIHATVTGVRVWTTPGASIKEGGIDTICTNETIRFINNSTQGYYGQFCNSEAQYFWDFGNGETSTAELMPPMSWPVPGVYDVELTATNFCGTTTDSYPIVVLSPPIANAVLFDTAGCAPFIPDIENTSTGDGLEYLWKVSPDTGFSFLNGTDKNSIEPEISFSSSGVYKLVLYAFNVCDQTDSLVSHVHVYAPPEGTIRNLSDLCITNPVIHPSLEYNDNGSPITSFLWTFAGGNPASVLSADPGEITYSSADSYRVDLRLQNECGIERLTDVIQIHEAPEVQVLSPVSICESNSLAIAGTTTDHATSLWWETLGDGIFSNDTLRNPIYYPGVTDLQNLGATLRIIGEGESPCSADTATIDLAIQQAPIAQVDDDVFLCEGTAYDISNSLAENFDLYYWSTSGDGYFSDSSLLLPTYFPGSIDISRGYAEVWLTAEAIAPCQYDASDTIVIHYASYPTIDAGPDSDICENGSISLNASGTGYENVTWRIETGEGSFSDPAGTSTLFTLAPGFSGDLIEISIEATGRYGCDPAFDTIILRVIPSPKVFAGDDAIICESSTYQISDAALSEYSDFFWTVEGDGTLDDSTVMNPVYSPGMSDISTGMAGLTLHALGNSVCADTADEVIIQFQLLPHAYAGDDQDVCKVNNYLTTGQQLEAASIQWISLGTGSFEDENELGTVYYPSSTDKDAGSVELVLIADAVSPCAAADHDTVRLTFVDPPEVFAGNDTTICSDSFSPVNASVSNSTQFVWSTNGNGTLIDPAFIDPEYRVSESDIDEGSVLLWLTSTNPACPPAADTMVIGLTPYPNASAGADDIICENQDKQLDDSYAANYSDLQWSTGGDGSFDNQSLLHTSYSPGNTDIENGSVTLYLTVAGIPPCQTPEYDSITISVQRNPVVYAGPDTIVGEGETFTAIQAEARYTEQVIWSSLGDGSFNDNGSVNTTYIPGDGDLRNRGVYLVIRGTSFSPCVQESRDTLFLLITPKPEVNAGEDITICEGSDVTISTASASDYSELFWTSDGTGTILNNGTLSPGYLPSSSDIVEREVILTLHARGKAPIENVVVNDSMVIQIVHNARANVLQVDTACENSDYQIIDVVYEDVNSISWSSSGSGYFNGTAEADPIYSFSQADRVGDSIYFFLQVSSQLPCTYTDYDTLLVRIYHEPEPLFTHTHAEGCAPLAVDFSNISQGEELSYYWDFGNGLESLFENPGRIVFQQGRIADTTYTVTLEATNRCNSITSTSEILVKPVPVTDFGMDVAWGCSPKEIQFFNVTTGLADTYLWDWGDGSDQSRDLNPGSHIFVTGDLDTTYTISLVAENECGIDTMEKTVKIFPNTVDAFFETDTTFGCAPLEVTFTNYSRGVLGDEPFLNWSWNFGDGNSITDILNPVHVFTEPGTYTVTLHVNDTCSHDFFTTDIRVMEAPQVEFITDREEYCENDTVYLTPLNMPIDQIASVTWDFGDSDLGYDFNSAHIYDNPGDYTIHLSAKDIVTGCIASASKEIFIRKAPVAAFSIPDNDGCQTLQITFLNESEGADYYIWDFGNGDQTTDTNGQQLFTEAGTYSVSLKALDNEGCSDSVSHELVVNPKPFADFESSSQQTCFPPVEVDLTNRSQGADDYLWDFGNGSTSKATDPSVTYREHGDYTISLVATNIFHCSDTSEMVYHAYHNPVADFSADSIIGCDPFIVPFNNLSAYGLEYVWTFEDQGSSQQEQPVFTFKGEGVYSVSLTVIGSGGCTDSITRESYITTYPSPTADFTYTRPNEIDTVEFQNYSSGAISYIWDFGDGNFSEDTEPWHSYARYGNYQAGLTAINEYECKNTVYKNINFELFKGLYLPNAFAPNNLSEQVREFKAVGTGLIQYHLLVYDAWGNLLWETDKLERGAPAESWDGTYEGIPLNPDVYVWHLKEAIFKDGSSYQGARYGTITLIK